MTDPKKTDPKKAGDEGHWYDPFGLIEKGKQKVDKMVDDAKTKLTTEFSNALEQAGSKLVEFFTDTLVKTFKDGINAVVNWFTGFFTDKKIDIFGSNDPVNMNLAKKMSAATEGPKPAEAAPQRLPAPEPS